MNKTVYVIQERSQAYHSPNVWSAWYDYGTQPKQDVAERSVRKLQADPEEGYEYRLVERKITDTVMVGV